jgi:hypothetical protein
VATKIRATFVVTAVRNVDEVPAAVEVHGKLVDVEDILDADIGQRFSIELTSLDPAGPEPEPIEE